MTDFPQNGFLYIITGAQKYFDEALLSVRSIKAQHSDAHITVISDVQAISSHNPELPALVDNWMYRPVSDYDNWSTALVYKVKYLTSTPYENTVFLDTDTYIAGQVDTLFRFLDTYDMAIAEAHTERTPIYDVDGQFYKGYYAYNTGVIAYKRNQRMNELLDRWYAIYASDPIGYESDQPALMVALFEHPVLICKLRNNWNAHIPYYFGVSNEVIIFHGRPDNWQRIVDEINSSDKSRLWIPELDMCYFFARPTADFIRLIWRMLHNLIQRRDRANPIHRRYR